MGECARKYTPWNANIIIFCFCISTNLGLDIRMEIYGNQPFLCDAPLKECILDVEIPSCLGSGVPLNTRTTTPLNLLLQIRDNPIYNSVTLLKPPS